MFRWGAAMIRLPSTLPAVLGALLLALLVPAGAGAVDALHNTDNGPQAHRAQAAPHSKPQPKPNKDKPDKDKNCGWGHDIDIDIEYKHITLSQDELKKVVSGLESKIGGFTIYSNARHLVLHIRSPEGFWYSASLMRIGSLNEGCLFYYVGTPIQLPEEPPLD